jgi:hypothetical protein
MNNINGLEKLVDRINVIENEVTGLQTKLDNVQANITSISDNIKTISANGQTNWSNIAAIAAVIVSVVLYHYSLMMEPIKIKLEYQEKIIAELQHRAYIKNESGYSPLQRSQSIN